MLFHQLPPPVSLRYLTDFRKIAPPALRFRRYARHNLDLVAVTRCKFLTLLCQSFKKRKAEVGISLRLTCQSNWRFPHTISSVSENPQFKRSVVVICLRTKNIKVSTKFTHSCSRRPVSPHVGIFDKLRHVGHAGGRKKLTSCCKVSFSAASAFCSCAKTH